MDLNKKPAKIQSKRACLCVLCGLPGSGKSTLAQAVKTLMGQQRWRSSVISYDDLIPDYAFHSKPVEGYEDMEQRQTQWRLYRQAILQCVERILQDPPDLELPQTACQINSSAWRQCVNALRTTEGSMTHQMPLILLLDDNFYYQSMRYEVYQLARKYSIGFCQVYLHCPVESCIDRNQRRPQALPSEVIVAMNQRLEPPNPEKNPWERSSISLDTKDSITDKTLQRLKELISIALDNPLSPVQDDTEQKMEDRLICANSVVHQADQACRHRVSQVMQKAREKKISPHHMRSLAAELKKAKTTFLQNLRKKVLQDLPISSQETIDGESVAKGALELFDQDTKEIMAKFLLN